MIPAQGPVPTLSERLRQAAASGQADRIRELCRLGVKIDCDEEGRNALHLAAANGHLECVKLLLNIGVKINAVDMAGFSALHHAASEGHVEVVKFLLKSGSHVDAQNEVHGNTSLHEAAWKGYSQTLEVLCKYKANVYIKNKGSFSALHLACQNGHNQSCRVLLLAGCKPDIKNNYGDTPLHTSARYGHAGVMRILISAVCQTSETNKNKDTALHISAAMGRRKLTKILLEAKCDASLMNKQGETAMDIAKRKNFQEVQEILAKSTAKTKTQKVKDEKKHKKRDKDSGTSQDSSSKHRKDKNKKSKHGHKVHFKDECKKEFNGHTSPYGCHMFPNLAYFPSPNLDSLPSQPLQKGEQYYTDLAGNIQKGPVGVGYTCYCAPFFHHVEKKLEADKQELIDHIDHAHENLNAKITNLEKHTRSHLFSINQTMKEKLAEEKNECLDRLERQTVRDRIELDKRQAVQTDCLKSELISWVKSRLLNSESKRQFIGCSNQYSNSTIQSAHVNHLSLAMRKSRNRMALQNVLRSKSAEVLSEPDNDSQSEFATRIQTLPSSSATAQNHKQWHTDFNKLGARPKYGPATQKTSVKPPSIHKDVTKGLSIETSTPQVQWDSRNMSNHHNDSSLKNSKYSLALSTSGIITSKAAPSPCDSGYNTKPSPGNSDSSNVPYCKPPAGPSPLSTSHHPGPPASSTITHVKHELTNGKDHINSFSKQTLENNSTVLSKNTEKLNHSSLHGCQINIMEQLCKMNEGLKLCNEGHSSSLV